MIAERLLASGEATLQLGMELAARCRAGCIVYLQGDLGAGKTTVARGFLRGLGYRGAVKSPTFTLVEPYEVKGRRIYHFDLYRVTDPGELEYLGIRDYFDGEAVCLIEWPEKAQGVLPAADLLVRLSYAGSERRVRLEAMGERADTSL